MNIYKDKYLKYKKKYLKLKYGGAVVGPSGGPQGGPSGSPSSNPSDGKNIDFSKFINNNGEDKEINWELFNESKINIDETNENGDTFLTMAASLKGDNIQMVEEIIYKGANINYSNEKDENALILAIKHDNFEIVDKLLNYGAKIYKKTLTTAKKSQPPPSSIPGLEGLNKFVYTSLLDDEIKKREDEKKKLEERKKKIKELEKKHLLSSEYLFRKILENELKIIVRSIYKKKRIEDEKKIIEDEKKIIEDKKKIIEYLINKYKTLKNLKNGLKNEETNIKTGHISRIRRFLHEFFENQTVQNNILYKHNPIKPGIIKLGTITENIYKWVTKKLNMSEKELTFSNFKDAFLRFSSYTFGHIPNERTKKIMVTFNTESDDPIPEVWDDIAFNLCLYLWQENRMNEDEVKEILGQFNYLALENYIYPDFELTGDYRDY